MSRDLRIDFIVNQLTAAAREIKPDAVQFPLNEETEAMLALAFKMFDRILPMIVSAIMIEVQNQKMMP